jgi:hypothetical protein
MAVPLHAVGEERAWLPLQHRALHSRKCRCRGMLAVREDYGWRALRGHALHVSKEHSTPAELNASRDIDAVHASMGST